MTLNTDNNTLSWPLAESSSTCLLRSAGDLLASQFEERIDSDSSLQHGGNTSATFQPRITEASRTCQDAILGMDIGLALSAGMQNAL